MPSCGVRLSVCLSRSCILSKRITICLKFLHRRVATPFYFFHYQTLWQYSDREPLTGTRNAGGGRHRLRFLTNSWLSIDDWQSANNNWDRPSCSLPHTPPRISESFFITNSTDDHDEDKRIGQNLFVRSGKSESELTNNRRLR